MHSLRLLSRLVLAGLALPSAVFAVGLGCQTAQGGYDPAPRATVEGGSEKCVVRFVEGDEKAELSSAEKKFEFKAGGRRTLYLNRFGGTYTPGTNNSSTNRSSIASYSAKIPAYAKGDARWSKLLTCVQGQFARWNLEVTDKDPKDTVHIEAVVGGLAGNLGLSAGIGGIAPMTGDCDNPVVERAIVFVFSQSFPDDQEECQVVAHEAGHALGLDHEYLCADPMTYLRDCGEKKFQDKAASCGTYSPQSCTCGSKQNSVKHLDTVLGPPVAPEPPDGGAPPPPVTDGGAPPPPTSDAGTDGAPPPPPPPPTGDTTGPTITLLSPTDGEKLPEFSTVTVSAKLEDPSGVGKAVLRWSIGAKVTEIDCASPFFEVSCTVTGSTYTWKIPAGKGARTWSIVAVDGKGNSSTSAARGLALGDSTPPPPPPPPPPMVGRRLRPTTEERRLRPRRTGELPRRPRATVERRPRRSAVRRSLRSTAPPRAPRSRPARASRCGSAPRPRAARSPRCSSCGSLRPATRATRSTPSRAGCSASISTSRQRRARAPVRS
ncbi:MAG: hypothetical protein IPJ34_26200 [Myxococcales bacterium]|nr:hypothetical protein [Myxococcales bacterium]